eukprot:TRINITY_DN47386_c0_g1_i1.p1 TRINITY_DN47386_c0_g1~~TRINITY_DN47386_c0_g1_i1.p1  ORF type:complete len:346 (+),score=87.29 TRINITY_DN47386_c0_g1_i1:93-1040(+)
MAARSQGRTASSVGMMEGAFFVSRTELLQWLNGLLQLSLTKVEQCASGAVYCQIIDACSPGSVAMKKVNWMAKTDHEYIPNYKVLQTAFDKLHIERNVPVDQLIRAKYQDNLEFLQWMKHYWELEGGVEGVERRSYDAAAARDGKMLPAWAKPIGGTACIGASTAALGSEKENLRPRQVAPAARGQMEKRLPSKPAMTPSKLAAGGPKTPRQAAAGYPQAAGNPAVAQAETEAWRSKVESQEEEIHELRTTLDGLERERDYYFRKLREVEILCSTLQANMDPALTSEKVVEDVQSILYAESDEHEEQGGIESSPA